MKNVDIHIETRRPIVDRGAFRRLHIRGIARGLKDTIAKPRFVSEYTC